MPAYRCVVSDARGRTRSIVRIAADEDEAARSFSAADGTLVSVDPAPAASPRRRGRRADAAIFEFTEMMTLLVESGLSLKDGLELCASVGSAGSMRELAEDLLAAVSKGSSFSAALDRSPFAFPPIYRGMMGVGDRIGSVERIFPRLTGYLRDRKALREKIAGALSYPLLVLAVSVSGAAGIAFLLLPRMETMFESFGGDAVLSIKSNMRAMRWALSSIAAGIGLSSAAAIAAAIARRRSGTARGTVDRALLRAPLLGPFISSMETLNFAFAMETLSSAGVPVEAAIEEASAVVGNLAYRTALLAVRSEVVKGRPLSAAFADRREVPPYVGRWLAVGERSGQTEKVFAQIRSYFQRDVERRTGRVMALAEPVLIVAVGALVIALVLGFVVPLFSMYGSIL